MFYRFVLPLSLAFTAGCQMLTGCDLVLQPSIQVTVLDSISHDPLPANEVTVVAIDGPFVDTAEVFPDGRTYGVILGRPGHYAVEVSSSGYETWERANIRVEGTDQCDDPPTKLTALMQRAE